MRRTRSPSGLSTSASDERRARAPDQSEKAEHLGFRPVALRSECAAAVGSAEGKRIRGPAAATPPPSLILPERVVMGVMIGMVIGVVMGVW